MIGKVTALPHNDSYLPRAKIHSRLVGFDYSEFQICARKNDLP